jgi:hypothetical protein
VLAAAPVVSGRDVFRLGIGAVLVLLGSLLVRAGLSGTPSELEQLVTSGLIVGLGGAVGVIVMNARQAVAGLVVSDRPVAGADPVSSTHLRVSTEPIEERVRGAHRTGRPDDPTPR